MGRNHVERHDAKRSHASQDQAAKTRVDPKQTRELDRLRCRDLRCTHSIVLGRIGLVVFLKHLRPRNAIAQIQQHPDGTKTGYEHHTERRTVRVMRRLQNRRCDKRTRHGAHLVECLMKRKSFTAAYTRGRMRKHGIARRCAQRLTEALKHDKKRYAQHASRKSHGGNSETRCRIAQKSKCPIAAGTIGSRPACQTSRQRSCLAQTRNQANNRRRSTYRIQQRTLNRKRGLVHNVHQHAHNAKAQDKSHGACRAHLCLPHHAMTL